MKYRKSFGVVLIRRGCEAGEAASFHNVGTLARIVDFDKLEDGFLGLRCYGRERFRVTSHMVEPDQLIVAQIERITENTNDDDNEALLAQYKTIFGFLRKSLKEQELKFYRQTTNENWGDANWMSYELTRLLPMTSDSRQVLLELTTAERLSELIDVVTAYNLL